MFIGLFSVIHLQYALACIHAQEKVITLIFNLYFTGTRCNNPTTQVPKLLAQLNSAKLTKLQIP